MSPLLFTARCLALPILSTTTSASKLSGKNKPPLSAEALGKVVDIFEQE
jgi:hypothetical protein